MKNRAKVLAYKRIEPYLKWRSKDKTPTIADEGLLFWWAHQDLNLGPKDSGLCSFHYSLDYAFIICLRT